ncbi:MAG: hypothetical protein IT437_03280 [Phycisphaerales bacterium]|nr:hypothetical protein [Phycisphaerales bacterium]
MPSRALVAAALSFALALPAAAQSVQAGRARPFAPVRKADAVMIVRADRATLESLTVQAGPVTVEEFPIPGGRSVTLDLERFTATSAGTRFVVGRPGGRDRPFEFDTSRVVMLRGSVRGLPGSHVFLSFSPWGSGGSISLSPAGEPIAVTSRSTGPALASDELAVFQVRATPGGGGVPIACGVQPPAELPADAHRPSPLLPEWRRPAMGGMPAGGPLDGPGPIKGLRQIQIAVETDFEFFSLYGDLNAAAAYVTQLYGAVSDIYIRDVNTRVEVSYVRLWDTPSGLYPGEDPLAGFRSYWNANMGSVTRDVAQYCSGRRDLNAGGVAYLAGLCNTNSYSWIGYIDGFFADPAVPHVHNHDIMVAAHELGHNCNTPHTHDMGLDTCDDGNTPPRRGTIMSYCGQTFTGGAANQDLYFHALQQVIMEQYIGQSSCIATDCNRNGLPDAMDIASGFSQDTNGNGIADECEDCNHNGVLDPQDIAAGTVSDLNANTIPDTCEPDCNNNGLPDDMDFAPRISNPVFADNFESDRGWTTEILGATDGAWERGVPVNDPNWANDPTSDGDGSGRCFLTANRSGNSDVDAGSVRLTSPVVDLSQPGLSVAYMYFLSMTNSNGTDRLLVEGNNAGGAGAWIALATHDQSNGLDWRTAVITPQMMQQAGLVPTATMQFRFTANDGNPQSIVEAGVDAFIVGTYSPAVSQDFNANNIPDECERDDDANDVLDYKQICTDMSLDLDRNGILDAYEDCDNDQATDLAELDHSHNVWIAALDHNSPREYLAMFGTFTQQASAAAALQGPLDLLITPDRRVLASSSLDNRVVEMNLAGAVVRDLVPAGAGGLSAPAGMLISSGRLLVASSGTSSVIAYDLATGAVIGTLIAPGAGGLTGPFGLAASGTGTLLVSSADHRVLEYNITTGAFIREFISAGSGGLSQPRGILYVPATGRVLVASYGSNAVLEYNGTTGAFIGKFNHNGTATVMTLEQPTCLRLGPEGNVYVSRTHDQESPGGTGPLHLTNARIYEFRKDNGFMMRAYIQGVNSGIDKPTGFDFVPDAGTDCNNNTHPDNCDIAGGFSRDINQNGIPDECEGVVPCYPDCNGDGALNLADFGCFQTKFALGDPYADCNGDGVRNLSDFGCFTTKFALGCP